MQELKFPIEPLKSNRWIIKFVGLDLPPYLFSKYKMYNEGGMIFFKTQFYETVHHSYNPKNIFNIEQVIIEYLDPIGDVINGLSFKPKGINFKRKHSYSDDDLMITKLTIIIDIDTLKLLYKNSENGK